MKKEITPLIFCILVATIGRIVPHPANVTPIMSLVIMSGLYFNHERQLIISLVSLVISDYLLSVISGYQPFGLWTIFTYTGFISLGWFSKRVLSTSSKLFEIISVTALISILYWFWTNFGTWLLSGMYPHSLQGLIYCYVVAIPFLKNGILGNLGWVLTLNLLLLLQNKCKDATSALKGI